ncbi:hypothetical protein Taro_024391 [Colocasia esculenta]|uniref:SWIM-type domain-containing protein n=1 Tax=Colocasia esculenta TaxID=4460 RepID=A0A843VED7_COLES|nr:hypothetical protein [Colocasia esculenta]
MRKLIEASGGITVICSYGKVFEVVGRPSCVVNLEHGTCSCRGWQLLRLLCKHVCAVLHKIGGNIENYCSLYFTSDMYRTCYEETIQPISYMDKLELEFDDIEIRPPLTKKRPGRRKKNRIPSQQSLEVDKIGFRLPETTLIT